MSPENIGQLTQIQSSITTLSTIMEESRKEQAELKTEQKSQTKNITDLNQTITLLAHDFKSHVDTNKQVVKDIDDKFSRDYKRINELEKRVVVENGVNQYKENTKNNVRYLIYLIGGILGLIITINSVLGIVKSIKTPAAPVSIERTR